MNSSITSKEKALLTSIATSEYQDGSVLAGNHIWLDYVAGSKSLGGVLSSLMKKGLVDVVIVEKCVSNNRFNGISDSTVALTESGVVALGLKPDATEVT